jgi:cytochrome c-type biogenesis protein CcsB
MSQIFFYVTLALYGSATVAYLIFLFRSDPLLASWSNRLISAGFIAHLLSTIHRFVLTGQLPITNMHESLSFFSLTIVGLFIYFERRYRVTILGSFVTPLALVMIIGSSALPNEVKHLSPLLQSNWFWVHALVAFISYAAFTITCASSVMYLIQQHFLKKKHFGSLFRKLPSLETLDDISYRCLTIGFPLLTVAIISGAIWSEQAVGSYWNWSDKKQTWSLITWFIYAALLHGRLTTGWRGKKAAQLSIIGFLVLLITFICMKHSITW